MKLYATIENEDGKKDVVGGGNKWVEVDLTVGNSLIGRIILDEQGGDDWILTYQRGPSCKQSWTIDSNITPKPKAQG
jgi:hypothetical protein